MSQKLEDILAQHGCAYRQSGRFEILTRCPLCGEADPSEHLAISVRKRGWRCLRNPRQHRGKSYVRLLTLLLRCSYERAQELLGVPNTRPLLAPDEFSSQWRRQLGLEQNNASLRSLELPSEARKLTLGAPRSGGFWKYLEERGFSPEQAKWAAETYDFHYALSGRYAYRLIIPVYSRTLQLMTWTARSVTPNAGIRYLTLSTDYARCAPGELLLGLSFLGRANPARCLVVCEGPFDAIAVSAIGHEAGVLGTCLFGLELSDAQADLLTELCDYFDRTKLLIDNPAWTRVLGLKERLPKRCRPMHLPEGFKDPGVLIGSKEGEAFVHSLV